MVDLGAFYIWHVSKEGDGTPTRNEAEGWQVDFNRQDRGENCCAHCVGPDVVVLEDIVTTGSASTVTTEEGKTANACGHKKEDAKAQNAASRADGILKSRPSTKDIGMNSIEVTNPVA